jgi:hypothetical protein
MRSASSTALSFSSYSARFSTGSQLRKGLLQSRPRRPLRLSTRFQVRRYFSYMPSVEASNIYRRREGCSNQGTGSCRWARKGEVLQRSSGRSTRRQDVGLRPTGGHRSGAHLCNSAKDAENLASQMLGSSLITKQTGAGGRVCNAVRVSYDMCARHD